MNAIRTLYLRLKLAYLQRQIFAVSTARAALPDQLAEYVAQINRNHQHALRIANKSSHAEQIRLDVELSELAYQRTEVRNRLGMETPQQPFVPAELATTRTSVNDDALAA